MIVDPPAGVETWVMVVALGVGVVDIEGGCVGDVEEKNDELGELNVEEELDDGVVLMCDEDGELKEKLEEDEMVEESEEEIVELELDIVNCLL